MRMMKIVVPLAALAVAGCSGYSWKPSVPAAMRTVAVPTFANESDVTELGSVVTRQILREFQQEGTYRIVPPGRSAVEVQGRIRSGESKVIAYERNTGARNREHGFDVVAEVSFVDKTSGRILVDNRVYRAHTTFLAGNDVLTGRRDASGRIAEELARQIVDDALGLGFSAVDEVKGSGK